MNAYSGHFIVAMVLATAFACVMGKTRKVRLLALPVVPLLLYTVFYNYDYSLLEGVGCYLVSYSGAVVTSLLFLFASSYCRVGDVAQGVGRSLFADRPTALEHYGVRGLDSLLRERSHQYDYFLFGK